jgi:hypothetical protein
MNSVYPLALSGGGKNWSLAVGEVAAGTVKVYINKAGIETVDKTVAVYRQGETTTLAYTVSANGAAGDVASTALAFVFEGALASLKTEQITIAGGTGAVTAGTLSGEGASWHLPVTVTRAGTVTVSIAREGVDPAEKIVTVHRSATADILWTVSANGAANRETSTLIAFAFDGAVSGLAMEHIIFDENGMNSVYPLALSGGGTSWQLQVTVLSAGTVNLRIDKEGIETGEKTVAVYRAGSSGPEDPESPPVLAGIEIASLPDVTLYAVNQAFNPQGLAINGKYDDGSVAALEPAAYTLVPPNMASAGPKMVNITCGTFSVSFPVYVSNADRVLNGVELIGVPKTTYELGEEFSKTGLQVKAHYSDGDEILSNSTIQIKGYDKRKRGRQSVALRVNGMTLATLDLTVRVPASATVPALSIPRPYIPGYTTGVINPVYVKGMDFDLNRNPWQIRVTANGETVPLYSGVDITESDPVTWPDGTGHQTASLQLDDLTIQIPVYIFDLEPSVYFDYGYLRKATDPYGAGPQGTAPGPGKYYVSSGGGLVLSPVRFLIGYDENNVDIGASYSWTATGPEGYSASYSGEFYTFAPPAAGTYTVTVSVTGRNFITGDSVTKTATTEVVSFTEALPKGTFVSPLRNFSPGQFTQSGTGYGWSLGSALGYEVWSVNTNTITITGNAFDVWDEPGIVWVQEDRNGNGVPDEMWYEIKGSEDSNAAHQQYITRRIGITYYNSSGEGTVNEYGQIIGGLFFVDSKGRMGTWLGGWPKDWGVNDSDWVTYTGTLIRDGQGSSLYAPSTITGPLSGYVDVYSNGKSVLTVNNRDNIIRADGSATILGSIRFVKVQTAWFSYTATGEISTEIVNATGLPDQSGGFPMP